MGYTSVISSDGVAARGRAEGLLPSRLLANRHPLRLAQAFATIEDRQVPGALLALTEGFARMMPRCGGDLFLPSRLWGGSRRGEVSGRGGVNHSRKIPHPELYHSRHAHLGSAS